jgi:RimJ/RimL family protein N-acetyltransferase
MDRISTERLDLVLLDVPILDAVIDGRLAEVELALDAAICDEWIEEVLPLARMRREQIGDDPSSAPWLLRAVVLRAERKVIGYVNFHGPPAPEGWVEIGYTIVTGFRRRGFASETAGAMFDWAHSEHGVTHLRASIGPKNEASLRMIDKLGFERTGVQWDEEDGEELVFERGWPPG